MCRSDGYLFASSTEGAIRIDVHGNAAGTVTAAQATWAKMKLEQRERWRDKRKRKQEAREEAATQRKVTQQQQRRIGFAELRASAACRKQAAA